jgi:DNA-binding response OmpR family regulator
MSENSQKKILVVEDSPTQLKKLELILSGIGYTVVTAQNGVDGINKAYTENPDLIVSDILMPELNGYQFCRLIKNDPLRQHIPIILLTNLGESQDRFWGIEAGADNYIVKEDEQNELIPKIESLLNRPAKADAKKAPEKGQPDRHKSRVNYMLDKMVLESTISAKSKEITKNTKSSRQLINNFFELLQKLVDYSLAQFLIRAGQTYYCNMDAREDLGLAKDVVNAANDKVSQQVKMGISPQRQRVIILNEENILSETGKFSGESKLQSELIFPFLVEDEIMAVLSVHHIESRKYNPESENTLRVISQQMFGVIKYFLALEQNYQGRQWYIHLLNDKINRRFKKIATGSRQLSEELSGKIDEKTWQNLRQLIDMADESQKVVMDIAASLKPKN